MRVLQAWQQRRRDLLLDLLRSVRPAAVLVELFPFGRRKFHFELEPLLDACFEQDPRPAVLSSVRDVLVVPYDGVTAQQWAADKTLTYFDAVLVCLLFILVLAHGRLILWRGEQVHGDSDLISFDLTFAYHAKIKHLVLRMAMSGASQSWRVFGSGFVHWLCGGRRSQQQALSCWRRFAIHLPICTPVDSTSLDLAGEVLVSAGGGQSGDPGALFHAAAAARALCKVRAPDRALASIVADIQMLPSCSG